MTLCFLQTFVTKSRAKNRLQNYFLFDKSVRALCMFFNSTPPCGQNSHIGVVVDVCDRPSYSGPLPMHCLLRTPAALPSL